MIPRVLVIRSGANPFLRIGESAVVEVREFSSHDIESQDPSEDAFSEPADLCVFTSQVAAERVGRNPRLRELFLRAARRARVAAVGSATAEALRSQGLETNLVGGGSADALLATLPARVDGWRVLIPCGADASEELAEELSHRGARVSKAVVYRKTPRPRPEELGREIRERPFAAFCVTSPAAAAWLFEGLAADTAQLLKRTPAVALGRFTRRSLEAHGVERIAITAEPRFESALRLLEQLATDPHPE